MPTRRPALAVLLALLIGLAACQAAPQAPTSTPPVPTLTPPPPTQTSSPVPPTPTPAREGAVSYRAFYGGGPAWTWDQDNIARYLELNPELELSHAGTNLYGSPVPTAFYIFLDGNNPPDVFSGFIVGNLRAHVEEGLIADISDLWEEMGWAEAFPQSIVDLVTFDGRQYFVPMAIQWNPIWYRTDIFDEVGLSPPETWDELLVACDTLDAAGYIPFAVSVTDWTPPVARWFSYINLRLNGPAFHEGLMRGEQRYNGPRVRAVFEHWAELIAHNCFSEDYVGYGEAANQIFEGEAAMYNLGEWLSESYPEGLPDTFDFFSFPTIDPAMPRGEVVHLYGAYMLANSAHPVEGRALLAYLGSAESQTTTWQELNRLVSNLNVDPSEYTAIYQKGLTFVSEAEDITQLYEFNTEPRMAGVGLNAFVRFLQNPEQLDEILATLESQRALSFDS